MHRRRAAVACLTGLTAALTLVGCGHQPELPSGTERFEVPTYAWDRQAGSDALVSGRLAFTPDGCTLMYGARPRDREDASETGEPVLFPNAVGIRFANGVRAVADEATGEVFAVEGQPFEYGGGWGSPTESWTEQCGPYEHGEVATINDEPAAEPFDGEPPVPDPAPPTRVASAEERGWYAVPTFEWDPAEGGDSALLVGTVTMTDDGCAVIDDGAASTGLVIPNAAGLRGAQAGDDGPIIYASFPDGSQTAMASDGLEGSYGGGEVGEGSEHWASWAQLCPSSPVDALWLVQDERPWG